MKRIVMTGGGSAGHVTVNLALMPKFVEAGWDITYIGSVQGIERELVEPLPDVRYVPIASGKLRRYADLRNLTDPARVLAGVWQAYRAVRAIRPHVLFSKGGFVSVPAVVGAGLNGVPVVLHESDLTPGLANRLAMPFARTICTTFRDTAEALPQTKSRFVGAVVREALQQGDPARGRAHCGFDDRSPVLLAMGGSLGSKAMNEALRAALPQLTERYQVVHLCGRGHLDASLESPRYRQFEYLADELPDVMAAASFAVTRAGSNAIFELLALCKPMLLIPLPRSQSRGDQLLNARAFERDGFAHVLYEEDLTAQSLQLAVMRLASDRETIESRMRQERRTDALEMLYNAILESARPARRST